jgi:hypothetical protein
MIDFQKISLKQMEDYSNKKLGKIKKKEIVYLNPLEIQ